MLLIVVIILNIGTNTCIQFNNTCGHIPYSHKISPDDTLFYEINNNDRRQY